MLKIKCSDGIADPKRAFDDDDDEHVRNSIPLSLTRSLHTVSDIRNDFWTTITIFIVHFMRGLFWKPLASISRSLLCKRY